jgi:hypothetical protein
MRLIGLPGQERTESSEQRTVVDARAAKVLATLSALTQLYYKMGDYFLSES